MGLISNALNNESGIKELRNSRSQVNFKIKNGYWARSSVHAAPTKEVSNQLESTNDLFSQKAPSF